MSGYMELPQMLDLTASRVKTWWRIYRLKAIRSAALIHIDVAQDKIRNELGVLSHYQAIEMHTRRELIDLGVAIESCTLCGGDHPLSRCPWRKK